MTSLLTALVMLPGFPSWLAAGIIMAVISSAFGLHNAATMTPDGASGRGS